jgi:hypothetical protein
MWQEFRCTVNMAGPVADGIETPLPVIHVNLTDLGGSFSNAWFFASNLAKREILDVALAAMSARATVSARLHPPANPPSSESPYPECFRLYLHALSGLS